MDWSIHFLSGQNKFRTSGGELIPLTNNPVTEINAHGHKKNHPCGFDETVAAFNELSQYKELTSLYPFPLKAHQVAKILDVSLGELKTSDDFNRISAYSINDYNRTLDFLSKKSSKIIFVEVSSDSAIFLKNFRAHRQSVVNPELTISTADEHHKELETIFFKNNIDLWETQNYNNVWDVRKRRALYPNQLNYSPLPVDLSMPHYWVNVHNWWYNGIETIRKIMDWLELPIAAGMIERWEPIYRNWQSVILKQLQFQYHYKHIVDCIVNNWYCEIDLTFDQEVIIQHCLIYQHNLSLKGDLTKFPNNTKELHKLLEPNMHER